MRMMMNQPNTEGMALIAMMIIMIAGTVMLNMIVAALT
jgi:hypothetical protein